MACKRVPPAPRSLHYNAAENMVLLTSDADGSSYELYRLPKDGRTDTSSEPKRGSGLCAVSVGRTKFAVLERGGFLSIRGLENEVRVTEHLTPVRRDVQETKRKLPQGISASLMFAAGAGTVLLRSDDRVCHYDIQQEKILGELPCSNVKYAIWSRDGEYVASMSKHTLTIANKRMEHMCSVRIRESLVFTF